MKRSHDDISSPGNGDLPGENNLGNTSGKGGVKAESAASVSGGLSTAPAVGGARETNSSAASSIRRKCPYLDTINRNVLDFDFEKVWTWTLKSPNVFYLSIYDVENERVEALVSSCLHGTFLF